VNGRRKVLIDGEVAITKESVMGGKLQSQQKRKSKRCRGLSRKEGDESK